MVKAMILAAGEGRRLRPMTLKKPKPMLPVAGRPMLEYTVYWLKYYGICDLVMNLHYRAEAITGYFGTGEGFGVSIEYSIEKEILGTAGGARRVAHLLGERFVLMYGDVLTDLDLGELVQFHQASHTGPHLTMSLYRVPNPWECGIVELGAEGRITRFREKPPKDQVFSDLASAGAIVIDTPLLDFVPENQFSDFGLELFPALLKAGIPLFGWPLKESDYLIDIGSHEKYKRVQEEWPTERAKAFLK